MDIITKAVRHLENRIHGSGSEEGIVTIETNPETVICQYERGACLRATYGGRSAEFVTMEPIVARTRIGFMFGATLEKLPQRAAACAIMNVATGFFCLGLDMVKVIAGRRLAMGEGKNGFPCNRRSDQFRTRLVTDICKDGTGE